MSRDNEAPYLRRRVDVVPQIVYLPKPKLELALDEIRELKAQVKALQDRIEQLEEA